VEAIRMVTVNPAKHYHLDTGLLSPGKKADLIVVDDLENFNVEKVLINGELVAREGKALFNVKPTMTEDTFHLPTIKPSDFEINSGSGGNSTVRVIKVVEDQLLTEESEANLEVVDGTLKADLEQDILKIAVVERYGHNQVANGFVNGFDLDKGAIASSVAHDSHNIIVVGTSSEDMAIAVNTLRNNRGGLVAVCDDDIYSLKLPIAGLMSIMGADEVAIQMNQMHEVVKDMGCKLVSPFMTMSFMALLVIPQLKISDQGLFDVGSFQFVDVIK
jgi:Adenine deaminase